MTQGEYNSPSGLELAGITTYQSGVVQSAAYRALKRQTDSMLKSHGITTMQWFVIGLVYDAGEKGVRITELAKQVSTGLPYLTNMINKLEKRQIMHRIGHGTDSRSKLVVLNSSYRLTCEQIEIDLREKMRESLYARITPNDLRIYIAVLYKLAEAETGNSKPHR